jgi:hypothetical protein
LLDGYFAGPLIVVVQMLNGWYRRLESDEAMARHKNERIDRNSLVLGMLDIRCKSSSWP